MTAQEQTNNLKDKGTEDKNTNLHPDLLRGEPNNKKNRNQGIKKMHTGDTKVQERF
jgi:hypothetical protein